MADNQPAESALTGTSASKEVKKVGGADASVDLAEVGLDAALKGIQDEVLAQIPIVKLVYAGFKAHRAIRDFVAWRNMLEFLSGVQKHEEFFAKRIPAVLTDAKQQQETVEQLMVALHRYDQVSKAAALVRLFAARLDGVLSHEEFLRFARVLDRVEMDYVSVLTVFYEAEDGSEENYNRTREEKDMLRTMLPHALLSVDYSGWPRVGVRIPNQGDGRAEERFLHSAIGEKFLRGIHYEPSVR